MVKKNFLKNTSSFKTNLPKKIYIDRSDSTSNVAKLRALVNESEVKSFMESVGFQSVRLSDFTFEDQIQLFYGADFITGLHGAAFANLVFCKPQTKILEFQSTTAGQVIENLAATNKLNFKNITCKPVDFDEFNQLGHIKIPLNVLQEKIKTF